MRPAIVRHIVRSLHRRHLETGLLQDEWNEKISKMPELRDGRRTALADLAGGGFFIRSVASPGALAARAAGKPLPRRFVTPLNNKENVPPVWAMRATPPKKRSPLPDWYPRTPLRDITAIVKIKHLNVPIKVKILEWNAGGLLSRIEVVRQIQVYITRIDEMTTELIISEKEGIECAMPPNFIYYPSVNP